MANSPESNKENDELTKAVEAARAEAKKAIADDAAKGAAVKEEQKKVAQRLLKELKDAQDEATRFSKAQDKEKEKKNGDKAQQALMKVAAAAKEGVEVAPEKNANNVLKQLADRKLTPETAASIQAILDPFLMGEKQILIKPKGEQKSEFQEALGRLYAQDPAAAERVVEAVSKNATDYGLNENQVKQSLEAEKPPEPAKTQQTLPSSEIEAAKKALEQMQQGNLPEGMPSSGDMAYFGRFTEEQRIFIGNLLSPKAFTTYVENQIDSITTGSDQEKREAVSENITKQIGDIMNQLYINLQIEAPKKFFEENAQEDYLYGITATTAALKRVLGRTLQGLIDDEKKNGAIKNFLYVHSEEEHTTEEKTSEITDLKGEKKTYTKHIYRLKPLPVAKGVTASGFMTNLMNNLNHMQHRQEYLHNVRAMYNHPAGQEGFYGQLAHYSDALSGTDIDEMMLLPDGPLVYEAFTLYDKFLEEDFASLDWRHRANQFSNKLEQVNSEVEEKVIKKIRLHYPEKDETEIRNIVNIAVGMSRGVFMNEPEKGAYADPMDINQITGGLQGLVASYSTNDATSLNPFNPMHVIMRWGGEHHRHAYYFIPIEADNTLKLRGWNHNELWKNSKKYLDTYIGGRNDLTGKKLVMDTLMDMCQIGGPLKRKGWRIEYSTRDFFEYHKEDGAGYKKGDLNVLKSFETIENLGYEIINDFFFSRLTPGFKTAEVTGEKQAFFEYLYKNYILNDPKDFNPIQFKLYLNGIRNEQRGPAEADILSGKENTETIEAVVNKKMTDEFLKRVASYEIAWRFPTKFLRMDRDRFQKDGVSRWHAVQREMKMSVDDFNEVMNDILAAETLLRTELSEDMRKQLKHDPNEKIHNLDKSKLHNKLTQEKLEELLGKIYNNSKLSPEEKEKKIGNAVRAYNLIKKNYIEKSSFMNGIRGEVEKYTMTFGIEDTDFSFMAWRGAGPRIIPRAIGDIAKMEKNVIPGLLGMGNLLNDMATNGKHDFSPIIEYYKKVREAFHDVYGPGPQLDRVIYQLSASIISYFKKDTIAKPLFGIFGVGRRNSMAAEVAGRSTAVWEWDSRDIDRFCVALESNHLLRNEPYDIEGLPKYEPYWFNLFGHPIKTPFKRRIVDYEFNTIKLRKEFGATLPHMIWEMIYNLGPIALAYIFWLYFSKAFEESEGKKK